MTILYKPSFWMHSQLSIARFYKGITINGEQYLLANNKGGEPCPQWPAEKCNLVHKDFIPLLKKLHIDAFCRMADETKGDLKSAKEWTEDYLMRLEKEKESKQPKMNSLF